MALLFPGFADGRLPGRKLPGVNSVAKCRRDLYCQLVKKSPQV
jgi:hypothetical protein